MARKTRLFFENISQYVIQRSISGEYLFKDDEDYAYYLESLHEMAQISEVAIHAYLLQVDTIMLITTPRYKDSLSRMMQSLGIKYVAYFNKKYTRAGTLWEGRYRGSLIQDQFLVQLMHFVESFSDKYSSYSANAIGEENEVLSDHKMYELLGATPQERQSIYKKQALSLDDEALHVKILEKMNKQSIIATEAYIKELEERAGITLRGKSRGRPKKEISNQTQHKGHTMYKKLVALDKEAHKTLKVNPLTDLNFAKDLASTPLLVNEAALVAANFPVVFSADETPALIALTSLGGKNLAINEEGKYIVQYVPSFLRRYPFALVPSQDDPNQKIIVLDEDSSVLSKTKGKQLFTKEGEHSETLQNAISFLTDFDTQQANTTAIMNIIAQSGILEDREISVGEGDEKKVLVTGFKVVDREKLNALSDEVLASWVRKGIISFIDTHINSLSHIQTLLNLAQSQQ